MKIQKSFRLSNETINILQEVKENNNLQTTTEAVEFLFTKAKEQKEIEDKSFKKLNEKIDKLFDIVYFYLMRKLMMEESEDGKNIQRV